MKHSPVRGFGLLTKNKEGELMRCVDCNRQLEFIYKELGIEEVVPYIVAWCRTCECQIIVTPETIA